MNRQIRIIGISGSLRRKSYNSAALRAAAVLAPEGAVFEMFELDDIPLCNQDEEKTRRGRRSSGLGRTTTVESFVVHN